MQQKLAEKADKNEGTILDVICFLPPNKRDWVASGYLKYVLPLEEAKRKLSQLLDRLVKGEFESISISPTVFGFPKSWEKQG